MLRLILLACCSLWLPVTAQASGPDGVPDASFGSGGVATYQLGLHGGSPLSGFYAVGEAPDGKIDVAGVTGDGRGDFRMLTARVLDNGALDPTFGSAGANDGPAPEGLKVQSAQALVVEADNKVVVEGNAIERLTAAGQLDPSFATTTPIDVEALIRLGNGEFASAGRQCCRYSQGESAAIERQLPNGAPDPGFGSEGNGTVLIPLHPGQYSQMVATSVVEGSRGGLLVAGHGSYASSGSEAGHPFVWIAKLTQSGALDSGFGSGGVRFLEGVDGPGLLEPRRGGLVLIGASAGGGHMIAWGLTSEGADDTSFGVGGVSEIPIKAEYGTSGHDAGAVDGAGRVLVAGKTGGTPDRSEIARLLPNGALDASFGENGIALGPPRSQISALTVDSAGRALAAGQMTVEPRAGRVETLAMIERFGQASPINDTPPAPPAGAPSVPPAVAAALAAQIYPHGHAASIRRLLRHRGCVLALRPDAQGAVRVYWWFLHTIRKGKERQPLRVLVAYGAARLGTRGLTRLRIKLTAAGRELLEHDRRKVLRLNATATLSRPGTSPVRATHAFTLLPG